MSDNQTKVVYGRGGIGFCGLLFIVLLLLKVGVVETVVMGWSWWVITSPLWGPLALILGILIAGWRGVGIGVGLALYLLVTLIIRMCRES